MPGTLALVLAALLPPQSPVTTPVLAPAKAKNTAEASANSAAAIAPSLLKECVAAADRGLQWLAAQQQPSGAWTGIVGHKMEDSYIELDVGLPVQLQRAQGHGHMGVTALCGMAFLAGGHLPDRGAHGAVVQRTIDYVMAHVHENGFVTDAGTRMYSHAFATLFLAEVYGMAGGRPVKQALEKATNLIVDCQNQYGGWRYNPFDRETDLSVTVCQLQALRAARNIGIRVPDDTIARAVAYVQKSRVQWRARRGGQFYYKIYGRGAYQKPDEFAINAAAITALESAGIYDPELNEPTLDFLDRSYADIADYYGRHYYFWYGNYYACQAFFQAGGSRFRLYFERLSRDVLGMQLPDGRWRDDVGPGDEFSTAVACLLLQLPRQYLPIFQR